MPEKKIEEVIFRNVTVDYADEPIPMEPAMMDDVDEEMTLKGICIYNVKKLVTENVQIEGCEGEKFDIQEVEEWIKGRMLITTTGTFVTGCKLSGLSRP